MRTESGHGLGIHFRNKATTYLDKMIEQELKNHGNSWNKMEGIVTNRVHWRSSSLSLCSTMC